MRGPFRGRFGALHIVVFAAALVAISLAGAGRAQAQQSATISLTKTATPSTYSAAGVVINYTYHVTNDASSIDYVDTISVTDSNPAVTVSCPNVSLNPGQSTECSGSYTVQAGDVGNDIVNTAKATAQICGGECGLATSNTAQATVTFAPQPSWTLSKTPSPTTYSAAGQTISYSYLLTNTGNVSISTITVSDNKVATVTCNATSLAVGASTTCSGTYTTTAADVTAGSVTNTATAHGTPASGTLNDATAQATVTLTAQPSWTLSETPSPTTYSAAGQTINYSYLLTNTGNVSISAITLIDDKVSGISCPASTLAVGANMTCTGSYSTTTSDVSNGSITNHAAAHGTPASGTLANATAQATVSYKATQGSITIVKNASGGNGTFSFSSTVAATTSFTLTTVSGTASRSFSNLSAGTYKFTETDLPPLWKLTALSCSGDTGGTATTVDLSGRSVSIGLDSGESITCTFTNTFDEAADRNGTLQVIRRFLAHRMSL
jgi:uncharacterized repeat protein (TIGR01451 family)